MNGLQYSFFNRNYYNNIKSCVKNYFAKKNYYYFNNNNELSERKLFVLQRILGIIFGFYRETIRKELIDKSVNIISYKSNLYTLEQINSIIEVVKVVGTKKPFSSDIKFSRVLASGSKQQGMHPLLHATYLISHNTIEINLCDKVHHTYTPNTDTPNCMALFGQLDITIKKITEERLEIEFAYFFGIAISRLARKYSTCNYDDADPFDKNFVNTYTEALQGLYNQLKNSPCKIYLQLEELGGSWSLLDPNVRLLLKNFGYEFLGQKESNGQNPLNENYYEYEYTGSGVESDLSQIIEAADFRLFLGVSAPIVMVKNARKK